MEKEGSGEGIQFCSLAYLATTLLTPPFLGPPSGDGELRRARLPVLWFLVQSQEQVWAIKRQGT